MNKILAPLFYSCGLCGSEKFPVSAGEVCPECLKKLEFFSPAFHCSGCGAENNTIFPVCPQCLHEPKRLWKDAWTLFAYRDYGREVIGRFKFRRHSEIALPLGAMAAKMLRESGCDCNLAVPIPMNFFRRTLRGYNQAALFARCTADELQMPYADILHSRLNFAVQSSRNRQERHRAISHQFSLRRKIAPGSRILLIDDIFTTGATLSAASQLLLDGGAESVCVLSAARSISYAPAALDALKNYESNQRKSR